MVDAKWVHMRWSGSFRYSKCIKRKGYPDDNSYTRFVKASINVRMDENQKIIRIDNPTGQCGLDTKFFDDITDYLKNKEQ